MVVFNTVLKELDVIFPPDSCQEERPTESPQGTHLEESEVLTSPRQTSSSEMEAWTSYFQRMQQARRAVQGMKGWPHFKRVFMVSALSADGVADMKVKQRWRLPHRCFHSVTPLLLLKQILLLSCLESTHKWVNQCSRFITQVQQQRPESPMVSPGIGVNTRYISSHQFNRMYLRWSLCLLYLHTCLYVTVCDSGLCCCICVMYFEC